MQKEYNGYELDTNETGKSHECNIYGLRIIVHIEQKTMNQRKPDTSKSLTRKPFSLTFFNIQPKSELTQV